MHWFPLFYENQYFKGCSRFNSLQNISQRHRNNLFTCKQFEILTYCWTSLDVFLSWCGIYGQLKHPNKKKRTVSLSWKKNYKTKTKTVIKAYCLWGVLLCIIFNNSNILSTLQVHCSKEGISMKIISSLHLLHSPLLQIRHDSYVYWKGL